MLGQFLTGMFPPKRCVCSLRICCPLNTSSPATLLETRGEDEILDSRSSHFYMDRKTMYWHLRGFPYADKKRCGMVGQFWVLVLASLKSLTDRFFFSSFSYLMNFDIGKAGSTTERSRSNSTSASLEIGLFYGIKKNAIQPRQRLLLTCRTTRCDSLELI